MLDTCQHPEPTSEREIVERYAAVRRRIYGAKPRPKPAPEPGEPRVVILRDANAHVLAWREHTNRMTPQDIIRQEARAAGITVDQLRNGGRKQKFVVPRQRAAARLHVEFPDMSLPVLARICGWSDHTTALHALKKMGVWRNPGRYGEKNAS